MPESKRFGSNRFAFEGLLVLLVIVLLAGCSDEGGVEEAAGPTASGSPSKADACDLLTLEEAEVIVGGQVEEPKPGSPVSSDFVRLTDCTWMEAMSGRTLTVLLRQSEQSDNSPEAIAGIRNGLASTGPVEEVEGVGQRAFWGADQLHAFKGDRDYLTVSVGGFSKPDAAAAARKAAEIALARL